MMKFVALFALCCLVGNAIARDDVSHAEAIAAAGRGGNLEGLNLELLEDRKPVVRTRAPFEDLDLGATGRPATRDETVEPEENSHHGIGSGHDAEPEVSSTTGLPVVTDEATSAANSEPTEATSVPVTGSDRTDAPATDKPATDKPATDKPATDKPATAESSSAEPSSAEPSSATSTDSSNDSTTTEESNTGTGSNTDAPTTSESSNTDSSNTNTPTETTDSSNTEPTTDPTGEGNGGQSQKPKGLSTASISAIVIGGVLGLAVIVAVAMAVVRRRRMAPERRGILDA